jgi:hypothetical protein
MPEKVIPYHTLDADNVFSCPAVGKNNVAVVTLSRGVKACGHCIKPLRDVDGNKIPFTLVELFKNK